MLNMSSALAILATITTISGLRNAILHDFHDGERYEIRGTVARMRQDHDCHLVVSDGSDFISLTSTNGCTASKGDVIIARGHTGIDRDGHLKLYFHAIDKIGKGQPPEPVPIDSRQLSDESMASRIVRMTGIVIDIVQDDIDPRWCFLLIKDAHGSYFASLPLNIRNLHAQSLIGAKVSLCGSAGRGLGGKRQFTDSVISLYNREDITVLDPPPADPFDVPRIDSMKGLSPRSLNGLDRRRADGTVLAVWHGDRILIRRNNGKVSRVDLAYRPQDESMPLPKPGDRISALGFPRTDLFNLNLIRASFRIFPESPCPSSPEMPTDVSADDIFSGRYGKHQIRPKYHGQLIRLAGDIIEARDRTISLSCRDYTLTVDASACPDVPEGLDKGCRLAVTGICVINFENCLPTEAFPRIHGVTIVPRSAEDIRILSRPPWWTPGRLLAVIGILLASLFGFVVWNRILNRLVERRSRELLKEQVAHSSSVLRIDERTRLAVELHDSLSQNLAGVACQMAATRNSLESDPGSVRSRLLAAEHMLKACRTELRMCLFDLRSDMLEEPEFPSAIRKALEQVEHNADISIDFDIRRNAVRDSTAHALLCIIRELVANAVRHGHATHIAIAGHARPDGLVIAVTDDGRGFDPARCDGPGEGHFGLDGIRNRLHSLGGTLVLDSEPGRGTTATVEIPMQKIREKQ